MKYIIVVPDGASDYPIESLGGKTPLEAAQTPFMDSLAQQGILGRVKTVPDEFRPSSDIANLSLLGYEPDKCYTGRGPLEAANLGIKLSDADLAFRCNLITEHDGKVADYSAGHITDKEVRVLLKSLNSRLGTDTIRFYPGTSYRNLMVYKEGVTLGLDALTYAAPHDIMGRLIKRHLPRGTNATIITELIEKSRPLLAEHEINKVRIDLGENPANMIWLWGCGRKPRMTSFKKKFGLQGAVISAVDLIKGIGHIIGFEVIKVPGATGYYDTNYLGKAQAALDVLKKVDFVFLHVEATDEAGHNQDLRMKITCLERIDKMIVGTLIEHLENTDFRIMVTPDHPTPISKRTHTNEPVPFVIYGKDIQPANFSAYSEAEAQNSTLYFEKGIDLLNFFLKT